MAAPPMFNGRNTRVCLLRYEAYSQLRDLTDRQKTIGFLQNVEDQLVVPVASLAAYQAGDWATFVRDLLQAYPEQKEIAVFHPSDLVDLVRRVSETGKPDTFSGILAFHKEFEPIAKDCLARGRITKQNETEIFLEGIHPSVVTQLEAQARQKTLLKAWAQENGILVTQQPSQSEQQANMTVFEMLSKGSDIGLPQRQQPVEEYTMEQLLVEIEHLFDSQKNAFNGLTRSLIAEIRDTKSRQGSRSGSSRASTASAPPPYGPNAVAPKVNFSTPQQTQTTTSSSGGMTDLNQRMQQMSMQPAQPQQPVR